MYLIFFLVCMLVVIEAEDAPDYIHLSPEETEIARLALQNPDLYDGDIAGIDGPHDKERNGRVGDRFRWPGGVIPYVVDRSLANSENMISQAIDDYHKNTCVQFKKRTNERNYVKFFVGQGCYSHIGKTGGAQPLSLGQGCLYVGIIIHEIGHALGFYHEQSRSDRDEHLIIYLENVIPNMVSNFFKLSPRQNILYNAFDMTSIMIYGHKTFSKNGKDTLKARNGQQLVDPFNKSRMTTTDIERVKKMYNCH